MFVYFQYIYIKIFSHDNKPAMPKSIRKLVSSFLHLLAYCYYCLYNQIIPDQHPPNIRRTVLLCTIHVHIILIRSIHCLSPPRKLGGFHPFIILFQFVVYFFSSGVNKTVPCSVSVPISSTLVDFTIVPDFNVQLSPIKLYGSTTVLAPTTVA